MRRIVVDRICDRHMYLLGGEEVEGKTTPPITLTPIFGEGTWSELASAKPKTLELCKTCVDEITLRELRDLLQDHGEDPEAPASTPPRQRGPKASESGDLPPQRQPWPCPFCPEIVSRGSALGHLWGKHIDADRPVMPAKCPDCEYENSRGAAMGAHRSHQHGYDPLQEALDAAAAQQARQSKRRRGEKREVVKVP